MKLADTEIEELNKWLAEQFGIDSVTGKCMWRVVWSDDQFEKRFGTYTDYTEDGKLFIREVTEVRLVPKYRQWIQHKYILEHLVAVPQQNMVELLDIKMSYENLWTFEDKNGNPLPPRRDACEFIINTVLAAMHGTGNLKKYEDDESTEEKSLELKRKRVDGLVEELFGEQSSLEGTTVTGESVIVPRNFEKTIH